MRLRAKFAVGAAIALVTSGVVLLGQAQLALRRERIEPPSFDVDVRAGEEFGGAALRIDMLGDSLVAGVGASSEETSLGGHLAVMVAEQLERPVHLVGHGVSGAVTAEVLREQLDQVRSGVDVIVIEIGSNDVTHRTGLGDLEQQTRGLLRGAKQRAPLVVLGSAGKLNAPIFAQPLRTVVQARATQVRARQAKVAEELDVPFMDVAREVSPAYDAASPESSASDEFHPSDLGYEIWARPLADLVVAGQDEERREIATR